MATVRRRRNWRRTGTGRYHISAGGKKVYSSAKEYIYKPKRRRNPSRPIASRSNPGISGIIMSGVWVYAGMWVGGMVSGFISPLISPLTSSLGIIGGLADSLITAYAVSWIGNRTVGHGELMAAGAFAGTVGSMLGNVLGGASSLASSLGSGLSAGISAQPTTVTSPSVGNQNAQPLHMVK